MPPRSSQKRAATGSQGESTPNLSTKKTRFLDPSEDPTNFAEEVDSALEQTTRKGRVKDAAGYDSDSSDDGEGVVLSRRKEEKDEDDDMFAMGDEEAKSEETSSKKKKKTEYMRLGDIEGQEFGGSGSEESSEDEPLDEDEVERRKKAGMGFELSSFNMREEMEEGKFTEDGSYVRSFDPHGVHDRWMEGVDEREMKRARKRKRQQERVQQEKMQAEEEELAASGGKFALEKQLLPLLKKGETILEALQRLGKLHSKPDIEQVTHLASAIMALGDTDIYSKTYEELVRAIRGSGSVDSAWIPPSADRQFEYKWATPEAGQADEIFGPFGEEEMQSWHQAQYFGIAGEKVKAARLFPSSSMVEFTISDLLGYASIACWLGAQFPQVLENHRLKSCAGLALPFLANWLAGDISNLIGCILTDQLPFQMWLAAYFVTVDCALVTQYFYYQHYYPKPAFVKSRVTRRYSVDRTTSRYRTLSVVGANVAAAAALIVQEAEPSRWPRSSRDPAFDESVSRSRVRPEDDDESFAHMVESFRSERGAEGVKRTSTERYGRAGSMGRYSGMPPRSATLGPMRMTLSTELPADSGHRGRTLRRDIDLIPEAEPDRASRASRRGANLVMLGVFALFSIGSLAGGRRGMDEVTNIGRVVSPQSYSIILPRLVDSVPQDLDAKELQFVDDPLKDHPPHEHPSNPPSGQRVLGRFFAWLCTTLYLTSRLPQIWKNFVRKSVEGLSMYLFLFAFLGNSFYVASIVASPKFFAPPPASTEFIRESIPYLLGSGGTLMFDVTILTQSFLYRPKHHRRQRTRIDTVEEEAGLLSGDSTHNPPRSAAESVVHSRGRTST